MAGDLSGRRPRHHSAVHDVLSTLADASNRLADVQRRLDLEFRASYPDHANPAKLVARVKRIEAEVAALKDFCRDILAEKQEMIDRTRTSLSSQRATSQRLVSSTGVPLMDDADEDAFANLNKIIDEWTAQMDSAIGNLAGDGDGEGEDANQILFKAII